MPEISQIQTCVPFDAEGISARMEAFGTWLAGYGGPPQLATTLQRMEWRFDDDGYLDAGLDDFSISAGTGTARLTAQPGITGFSPRYLPELDAPWVEFSLAMDTESLCDPETGRYRDRYFQPLLDLMLGLFEISGESGVYFTNEWDDGEAWLGVIDGDAERAWQFDIGVIPRSLLTTYQELAPGFAVYPHNKALVLVNLDTWEALEWP